MSKRVLLFLLIFGAVSARADKKGAQQFYKLGVEYYEQGNYQKAIEEWNKSLKAFPTGFAYYNLGQAYFFLKNYRNCAQSLQKAWQSGMIRKELHYPLLDTLSKCLLQDNRLEEAGKALETMLKADMAPAAAKRKAIVHQLLQLRMRQKDCRAGLNLLIRYKGLVLDYPSQSQVQLFQKHCTSRQIQTWASQADQFLQAKKEPQALKLLKKIEAVTPNLVKDQLQLIRLQIALSQFEDALVSIREGMKQWPQKREFARLKQFVKDRARLGTLLISGKKTTLFRIQALKLQFGASQQVKVPEGHYSVLGQDQKNRFQKKFSIDIIRGRTAEYEVFYPERDVFMPLAWSTLGGGLLLSGIATVLVFFPSQSETAIDAASKRVIKDYSASVGLFIAGGVLLASSIVFFILSSKKKRARVIRKTAATR